MSDSSVGICLRRDIFVGSKDSYLCEGGDCGGCANFCPVSRFFVMRGF